MNSFDSLKTLSARTKTITLAIPDDIADSIPQWSPTQLKTRDENLRGAPFYGYKLEVKPGGKTFDFTIRRLTAAQQKICESRTATILPPQKTEQKILRAGEPPISIPSGWDEENPEYQQRLTEAKDDQTILFILFGVVGLEQSATGATLEEKITSIREALDQRLILILANEIVNWSYSAGDPADFFTNANS